uniref:NADH-ubiquinone oxidoreductase chain 2 n=1 Tax=Naesiotus nux TaxID=1755238 RepID=A0A0S2IAM0_NAENU|nr:NADH dehydrogenase subunit 2 [Naesiotus nux]ALO20568.1 NADH dehydrogenase subunit 2 [Naesiotus nux]
MPWISCVFIMMFSSGMCFSLLLNSWMLSWLSMELMMLGLYPMMYMSNKNFCSDSVMKYFLIQSLAAITMFLPGYIYFSLSNDQYFAIICLYMSIFLKLGLFPFHSWVIPVMVGLPVWVMTFTLGLAKLPPMWFMYSSLSQNSFSESMILNVLISGGSMLTGSLLMIGTSNLRAMLGASSISHTGWILASMMYGGSLNYIVTYLSTLFIVIVWVYTLDPILLMWGMLSFSGLPPFMLFIGKISLLKNLMYSIDSFFLINMIIISSIISLYVYMKFSFFFFLKSKPLKVKIFSSALSLSLFSGIIVFFY